MHELAEHPADVIALIRTKFFCKLIRFYFLQAKNDLLQGINRDDIHIMVAKVINELGQLLKRVSWYYKENILLDTILLGVLPGLFRLVLDITGEVGQVIRCRRLGIKDNMLKAYLKCIVWLAFERHLFQILDNMLVADELYCVLY